MNLQPGDIILVVEQVVCRTTSCGTTSSLSIADTKFTRQRIGYRKDRYEYCDDCIWHCVIQLLIFFSPASAAPLSTQQEFLRMLYNSDYDIVSAARQIEWDHLPERKICLVSNLKKRSHYLGEIINGWCVATLANNHKVKTRWESVDVTYSNPRTSDETFLLNALRKNVIQKIEDSTQTTILDAYIVTLDSVKRFMASRLWWGYRGDGTRPPLESCLCYLNERHQRILGMEEASPYMQFGRERQARLLCEKEAHNMAPDEMKMVSIYFPNRLNNQVTLEELQQIGGSSNRAVLHKTTPLSPFIPMNFGIFYKHVHVARNCLSTPWDIELTWVSEGSSNECRVTHSNSRYTELAAGMKVFRCTNESGQWVCAPGISNQAEQVGWYECMEVMVEKSIELHLVIET